LLKKRNIHQFIINKINNFTYKNYKKGFDNLIISNKVNYNLKQAKNIINKNCQTSLSIINVDKNFENDINDFIKNYIKEKEEQIIYKYEPEGLINFTSNCYLNSLFQCLY
jgi:ubiquitin C-terminal hydrolase